MRLKVLLFAGLREELGKPFVWMHLGEGARAGDVLAAVSGLFQLQPRKLRGVAVAVNYKYVESDCVLSEGDEVALIPPVSGGML